MMDTKTAITQVKNVSLLLAQTTPAQRNAVLLGLAEKLAQHQNRILAENEKDLSLMPVADPRYDRLELNPGRLQAMINDIHIVISLDDVTGRVLLDKTLPNGLHLQKLSVPLGVIGIIYESRPNVTIDVFSLCLKSGNAVILKGGKEAHHTNKTLVEVIQEVLRAHHLPPELIYLMPPEREAVHDLLNAVGLVDVCIPRGSQSLIDFVRENARIPVIETGAGIVHTYFDASGDLEKGRAVITNAKTRRVSVCNALDCLLVHQDRLNDLAELARDLGGKEVELYADDASYAALKDSYPPLLLHQAAPEDFGREFLSNKMAILTVPSYQAAITHIQKHTSGHSEAIITEDAEVADYFFHNVDAAALYHNASTAFTDGGQFGMGMEIGISTQKLHARGPLGLENLTSYKWILRGDGHIRA